jgi:predicted RNA-binding protein with RPS1 domain
VVPTFQRNHQQQQQPPSRRNVYTSVTATATTKDVSTSNKSESGECYYKRMDGSWKPRKELSRLFVGERLFAARLPEHDLLTGKTGCPKLFLECGVGKKKKGNWNIVNGMVRFPGKKGMKPSVVRKKAKKIIPLDSLTEVYVSKVSLEHGSFEVCLSREDALSSYEMIPASTLKPGEQLSGVVRDVLPYGVFVDVGANRKGLIHISKVANSQGCYINKEAGLKSAGLAKGSPVRVIVLSNEKKRLEFDLDLAEEEPIPEENSDKEENSDETAMNSDKSEDNEESNDEPTKEISTDEADMWAAYAAYENNAEEDDDYYDEDEDIEDALGIGSY